MYLRTQTNRNIPESQKQDAAVLLLWDPQQHLFADGRVDNCKKKSLIINDGSFISHKILIVFTDKKAWQDLLCCCNISYKSMTMGIAMVEIGHSKTAKTEPET